ncbi:MAG: right-handed parallel beta-helix repeat-containing protein [Candidatus Bathyarchaeota archaeon]|nr:MAG: right-handed parallel beta-helix repeat-containing protein [Candidatus Bathyarchaeota archaeon]
MQQLGITPSKSKQSLPKLKKIRRPWKKQLKMLSLLVTMIFGVLTFANSLFFFAANATYVEGNITQDTVWTLTDSPFVVSKNVIVDLNATLTIDPGVEVRFGGNFSLIVNGRLLANGTKDDMITFTSNKDQPEAGDWSTIKFSGTEQSIIAYCSVKYAISGTFIENGNLEIKNSEISNSQNGITITNGTVNIQNNEIANHSQSGIYVTGNNQVTIQNNTIRSNADGILLTGNSISGVNISQNNVLSNTQSGVRLDADTYSNIIILHNVLSANNKGFYVSGKASTYITNNSISYNNIGIFYEQALNHEAHFNDIYGNDLGMDISSNAVVNATYNYWGDESGPYHISLNPAGKGNPVHGDEVNLNFIFFLTAPIDYINERPVATLLTDKTLVPPNQTVTFIATLSSDDRRVDKYFFDFGDGQNSGWTTLSIFVHKYSSVGTYGASVTVMDDFEVTSNNVAGVTIRVQNLPPLDVSLSPNSSTVGSEQQVSITVHVTDGASAVDNASITLFSIKAGSFTPSSGFTNSTGYFTTTFNAPNVTQITNVRITATASKSGYADGSDYTYLEVLPTFLVQVTSDHTTVVSETTLNVTVHVTSIGQPAADVFITVSSDGGGNFSATTGTTDSNGDVAFVFTAPQATTQLNITITATATKTGYIEGQGQTKLTIEPKILVVQVTASPNSINSEGTSQVTVHVTYNATPISGVTVTVSSDSDGTFSTIIGTTDSNGDATFTFISPQTTTQLNVNITATATKVGYIDGEDQVKIGVNPVSGGRGGGLPLTTILIIAVPIIVVIVVALLIKFKIIVITSK